MTIDEWERRIAAFRTAFEASPTDCGEIVDELDELAAVSPANDGRGDFERACIRDSTGRTADAVSFYEAWLAAGLDPVRRTRTCVQMASSQRALGHTDEALAILSHTDPHALGGAPSAVRALALGGAGRHDEALRVALEAARRVPKPPGTQIPWPATAKVGSARRWNLPRGGRMCPGPGSAKSWLSLLTGLLAGILGLAPWLLTGARLPLQNLWGTQVLPAQMPLALLPLSQYEATTLVALMTTGGAAAGLALRLWSPARRCLAMWCAAGGVILVQVTAAIQAFTVMLL